jgi:hypothetical protein
MEIALGPQYRIYHIDHGSGWSPSAANQLFEGLAARGTPYLTNEDLSSWHDHVVSDPPSAIVNDANWGLADCRLDEMQIIPPKREASGDTRGGAAPPRLRTVR